MNPVPTEIGTEKAPGPANPLIRKLPYLLSLLGFIVANALADSSIKSHAAPWTWQVAAAVAAAALAYGMWRGERDLMQSEDELQQKIRTEALAHAFPLALAVMMLLGKLDTACAAPLPARDFWLVAALPYFLILGWLKRRYR